MNLLLIATLSLQPHLRRLLADSPHQITLETPPSLLASRLEAVHGYDAILLADGASSLPADGLHAGAVPLILPRVHNAAALLLGGADAYRALHARYDGALCFVPAGTKTPLHFAARLDCACLCYLADTALGLPDTSLAARRIALENDWDYFDEACDYTLLGSLLRGDWQDDAFLRVPPHGTATHSYDRTLFV